MKLLIFSFIFISWNSYSQQEIPDTLANNTSTTSDWHSENAINGTVSISKRSNEPQVIHNRIELENEIIRIDNHIESINSKIVHVNSILEEQLSATESGWFDDMEQIKVGLNNRKLEIQNILINN